VHVHSVFAPDGSDWIRRYRPRGWIPCVAGTDGVQVLPEATPLAGETVVVKHTFDAFIRTELDALLRDLHVEAVLVAGLVTSTCVLFTATSAMQHGYTVGVVENATADQPSVHARVLQQYPFVFDVVTVDGAVDWTRAALARTNELGPMPAR
jgi:nicotinamidase-related amidase